MHDVLHQAKRLFLFALVRVDDIDDEDGRFRVCAEARHKCLLHVFSFFRRR
ncbi:hypothetical protein D9M72_591320 [compost metagenome]